MKAPRATYRLQFRDGLTFDRAANEVVPYIRKLGVSHLYASPVFSATRGSTHGYDVTDHNQFDPALGGREGFERLSAALKDAGLGLILDIVPNHMAASLENPWWRSVAEWGEQSPFARHFDIDWRERLTLPVLGKPFDEALAAGEFRLRLDRENGALALAYYENLFPLHPGSYGDLLRGAGVHFTAELSAAVRHAAPGSADRLHEAMRRLASDPAAAKALETHLQQLSLDPETLSVIHDSQPWRLQFWKEARKHLSYRRFFEVTGLAGVRVEDEPVFRDVHRLVLELVHTGQVQGLRIDHVDGLADPRAYLRRLRAAIGPNVYLVVEKILGEGEALPPDWPIEGTTGYEFAAAMPELFVDENGRDALRRRYEQVAGHGMDLEEERLQTKRLLLTDNFATELKGLARIAARVAEQSGTPRPEEALSAAIVELIAAFPFYRSYGDRHGFGERDRKLLRDVAERVRGETGGGPALDFVVDLLLGDGPPAAHEDAGEFRARFQQLTGPATAKAVEDTLFYRFNALITLNEVGGDPGQDVGSVQRFHERMGERLQTQPLGLSGTATHDTKRGEDARARLYALSEEPDLWADAAMRWRALHAGHVRTLPDGPAPEPDTEWLLYQALAGMWPDDMDVADPAALESLSGRFLPYVEKALREAKRRTSWTEQDGDYEAAVKAYAERFFAPDNGAFRQDFAAVLKPFAQAGDRNSLAQTLVKLTAPGIPDIYGGTEGSDFSLVDPDNRRMVDFAGLARTLDEPASEAAAKQKLIAAGLALRAESAELFARGDYLPLEITGRRSGHAVAFMRRHGGHAVVAVAARLTLNQDQAGWSDTAVRLPEGGETRWRDVLTGAEHRLGGAAHLAELLGRNAVALLRREG